MTDEKKKVVISEESAQAEIDRFLSYYDIDIDDMDDDLSKGMQRSVAKMKKAIMRGMLEFVDNDGSLSVIHKLKWPPSSLNGGDTLKYRVLDGKAKIAMREAGENDTYGQIYMILGSLCGLGAQPIQELKAQDLGVAEAVGLVFIAS